MMLKKPCAGVLALALCFFLLYPLVHPGLKAHAEEVRSAPPETELAQTEEAVTEPALPEPPAAPLPKEPELCPAAAPEGELVSIEDEYTKTYEKADGSFVTVFYEERQAYPAPDGTLKEIDNTLEEHDPWLSPSYYENADADYTVRLPGIMNELHGVSLEKDGNRAEMIPLAGDFTRSLAKENAVMYTEVLPGVDYQYTLYGDTIKEDIILNQYLEAPSFEFELKTGGLSAVQEDHVIRLYREGGAKPVFSLFSPLMTDASGAVSLGIRQTLREENGKTIVTVTPDAAWLSDLSRAYPVKIDPTITITDEGSPVSDKVYLQFVSNTNEDWHPNDAQLYGGSHAGFDNGFMSGNSPAFAQTRTYIDLNYDFSSVPGEARIDSAAFSLFQMTNWSFGLAEFSLSEMDEPWDRDSITWRSQEGAAHTFISSQAAAQGWHTWEIKDTVSGWVQNLKPNYGLVLKTIPERYDVQEEIFRATPVAGEAPVLSIDWSIPDPVPEDTGINATIFGLRPVSEKSVSGKLQFDGFFADGLSTPGAGIDYRLLPDDMAGRTTSSYSYKYPDSSEWTDPGKPCENGTKYQDKLSNWQTGLYTGLAFDLLYKIGARATFTPAAGAPLEGEEQYSGQFLIYRATQKDTFPGIANHYGVPLDTLMRDNRVQDSLIVEGNTVFVRDPQTNTLNCRQNISMHLPSLIREIH